MLSADQKTQIQITKNFKLSELEFHDVIPPKFVANATLLLQQLQIIRDAANAPITIISGYRDEARNAAVGGKDKSLHLQAAAADIKIKGMTSSEVYTLVARLMREGKIINGGLGVYETFTHVDIRGEHTGHKPGARWDERKAPVR